MKNVGYLNLGVLAPYICDVFSLPPKVVKSRRKIYGKMLSMNCSR
jgi:hypothetical protein